MVQSGQRYGKEIEEVFADVSDEDFWLAMKIWFEGEEHILPEEDLNELRNYLIGEIKSNENH